MLDLNGITKIYQSNKTKALDDISVSFRKQEFVAVVGPSGCGKTTLLNIIGGIDNYTSGELKINGLKTSHYKEKDWDKYRNKSIGFVFQNYNLIPHLNVFENIEMALILSGYKKQKRYAMVEEVLKKVSLTEVAKSMPNQLSGGQMQRVAIARAIIKNPDIILADEPTGALDSKTAIEIISILKEISKEKLVIMVTHNEELAKRFATREIRLLDGKLIADSNLYDYQGNDEKQEPFKKACIGPLTCIKLSTQSLLTKLIRTMLIVVAGSVGIIGVTLILTISSGIDRYIYEFQRVTLADAPITIYTTYDYADPYEEEHEYVEFPDSDIINVITKRTYYSHLNIFSEGFIDYINNIDSDSYELIDYSRALRMHIFTEVNNKREWVEMSEFTEMNPSDFVGGQYEVLAGKMATKANELVLLVDKYNNINAQVLERLGIDYQNKTYHFDDLIGKQYHLVLNDEYYYSDENDIFASKNGDINNIDIEKTIDLEIAGIIRINPNAELDLYNPGMLYTKALGDFVMEDARQSEIVRTQLEYGLSMDVLTGEPFEDFISSGARVTKEYSYESRLLSICYKSEVRVIRIYTSKFSSRVLINQYLDDYNKNVEEKNKIRYSDSYGRLVNEFNSFVEVLTTVLIVFALVSLLVSSIMITIITYVSVMERIKEIGILRSLGASRFDVANVFNAETAIIGFLSGVLGVIVSIILMNPIIKMITKILKDNSIIIFDLTEMGISIANPLFIIAVILGNVIITIIAGLIPAVIGARKSPVDAIRTE